MPHVGEHRAKKKKREWWDIFGFIGDLLSSPNIPKPPAAALLVPEARGPDVQEAAAKAQTARRKRRGRAATILTGSPEGLGSREGAQTLGA